MPTVSIEYPAGLPVPSEAPTHSAERRVLDTLEARAFQRDRLAYQTLTWWALTGEQALIWDAWWKTDLVKGGKWFSATWPLPEGWVVAVRRFIGTPRWDYIPAPHGYWRITADCEVRGVGQDPLAHTPTIWLLNDEVTLGGTSNARPWVLSDGDQTVYVPDELGSDTGVEEHYQGSVYSNNPRSAGKLYFEQIVYSEGTYPDGGSPTMFSFGIVSSDVSGENGAINAFGTSGTWGFGRGDTPSDGAFRGDDGLGGTTTLGGLPRPVTDGVVMVAIDIDAHRLWMGYDGTWFTGDPGTDDTPIATSMPGTIYNAAYAAQRAVTGSTLRSLPADFTYPIPTGFTPWGY